jgi:hypothetical protein
MSGSARETLFDDIERTDSSPMAYGESVFDFYNRVDRPEWARVRSELDEWYSHYPTMITIFGAGFRILAKINTSGRGGSYRSSRSIGISDTKSRYTRRCQTVPTGSR